MSTRESNWINNLSDRAKSDLLLKIGGRIRAEEAQDLSDAEIYRCLQGCALPTKLIQTAKRFRDEGSLNLISA